MVSQPNIVLEYLAAPWITTAMKSPFAHPFTPLLEDSGLEEVVVEIRVCIKRQRIVRTESCHVAFIRCSKSGLDFSFGKAAMVSACVIFRRKRNFVRQGCHVKRANARA